jgi:transposase
MTSSGKRSGSRNFPPELRERAVKMVFEVRRQTGERQGSVSRVAAELGIGAETLRNWVKRAEIDGGERPGASTDDSQRIAALERENWELRRANDILKAAAAFFGAELDRPSRR